MKRLIYSLVLLGIANQFALSSTTDTCYVPDYFTGGEGTLNDSVTAHEVAGNLSATVFKLEPYGYYVLNGTVIVPAGEHLTIVARDPGNTQATSPPQIVWTSNPVVNTSINFDCFGDITLENIWLLYANISGEQTPSCLQIEDDTAANLTNKGENAHFDGVIFDYSEIPNNASGAVGVKAQHFRGTFNNCYFRNCIDRHFRYWGRAMGFPYGSTGWHTDSISFENCTFANMGFVYNQEGGEYADYVSFNHCTFINIVMLTLESGWWNWLSVTNSVFVNTYMLGDIPNRRFWNQAVPDGGTITIDSVSNFGFSVPFSDADRHILFANCSYDIEGWLRDYMNGGNAYSDSVGPDDKPVPEPMLTQATQTFFDSSSGGVKAFPYINRINLYDSTNPGFVFSPTNQVAIKSFLYRKWSDNSDTAWAFDPSDDINQVWPMNEDLSYSNSTLKAAGLGGFPLGDLYHWWPSQYSTWKAQEATEHQTILDMLNGVGLPLAVEATGLAASVTKDSVMLTWRTQSEVNNIGFNIFRKDLVTGNSGEIASWSTCAALRGLGTNSRGRSYYFTDSHFNSAHSYEYTLESVEQNGTKKDYPPIRVTIGLPSNFALYQNYPNPFNPSTTICYDLPTHSLVRVQVCNILGQVVAELVNSEQAAGHQSVVWNAKVASGLYLYRIETVSVADQNKRYVDVKKMLLLK